MGGAPRGSVSDLLLGHGEDELALGAVRHGGLDDVADAGRGQLEVARVDERLTDNTSGDVGSPFLCCRAAFILVVVYGSSKWVGEREYLSGHEC